MDLAWLSLGALLIAIVVSCFTELNVGVLSLAFAWIIGVYFAGFSLGDIVGGFPTQIFLTLVGVTLLFSQAHLNGTLDNLTQRAVRLCRGNVGVLPIMFFALTSALAAMGPGNISSAALVAPLAMSVAGKAGVPVFLMALMVGNGAGSGSLSPFAPTGIIVSGVMTRIGMPGHEFYMYWTSLVLHMVIAVGAYFLFGGWRLFKLGSSTAAEEVAPAPLTVHHWVTLAVIATLISSVMILNVNVGMAAFTGAVLLALFKMADHREAMKRMPWSVIMLVSGVTVLIALVEKTQGMELFTAFVARFATRESITGVIAFVTGLVSVYSSTSGVVLPAFLPTIPGLVERLGGGDPLAIAASMSVASHLVDVSPLSTIGALCMAALPPTEDSRALFNKLLA
jgi:di/tricarboxylate transporter